MPPQLDTDVLIVGAGPTGLVLALWLTKLGVRVRIIDRTAAAGTTTRAIAVQARTLELYAQMGLAEEVVKRGRRAVAVNLWVAGKRVARAVFGDMGAGISPFPYALIFSQDEHERLLIDHLTRAGVLVERETELTGLLVADEHIVAHIRRGDGTAETCQAAYVAGCDGAHSAVRQALDVGFPGGSYDHVFYVADVQASGAAANDEVHVGLDRSEFLAVFPLEAAGHSRLVGTVRDDAGDPTKREWSDVSKQVMDWMRIDVQRVNWFSTYRVHHRVADTFRRGRAFLLGDAAHVHSPVGGQGMNTGIGDAVNLAWKLAAVVQHRADASLLDSYEPERRAFALRLVATTDRAFTAVTSSTDLARRVRLQIVPRLLPVVFRFRAMRRFLFRTVSQTAVNYRGSALSEGRVGSVLGGDRLPWVATDESGQDNYAALTSLDWQVHVYGAASRELAAACAVRGLRLLVYPWRADMARNGLSRDAVHLIRPDGYIALVVPASHSTAIVSYLDSRNLRR